jgi:hypothetical protein
MKDQLTSPPAGASLAPDAIRVQILDSEHSNLLSTRSISWSEASGRASMFLTILSAAIVALALVAQATGFGQDFRLLS